MESLESGVEKTPLVIHLPGFNEETIRETPLLEFYFAGHAYRRALDTLLNEAAGANVRPEQIKAFRDRGPSRSKRPTPGSRICSPTAKAGSVSHLRALRSRP